MGIGTAVWHNAHIRHGAVIGADCILGRNVFVDKGVVVGNKCKIQNNVSLYRGVHLEDRVFIGPSAVFTNDLYPRADAADWNIVPTYVREGASIGANATVVCGVELGGWSLVAAGSVVTHDVQPYELVAGNPARRIGWVCRCGRTLAIGDVELPVTTCGHCGRPWTRETP